MDRRPWEDREVRPPLERAFEESIQDFRKKRRKTGFFGKEETRAILELLRDMLIFFPEKRLTVQEVLESEWMKEWVFPEIDRSRRPAEDNTDEGGNRVEEIPGEEMASASVEEPPTSPAVASHVAREE